MDPLVLVVGLVLVFGIAYLVGYPLVRPEEAGVTGEMPEDEEDVLERRKEVVFSTLGEIEFDYQMGKLSLQEYEALSNRYKQQAVEVLKEEEADLGPAGAPVSAGDARLEEIEKEIEEEIARELEAMRRKEKE